MEDFLTGAVALTGLATAVIWFAIFVTAAGGPADRRSGGGWMMGAGGTGIVGGFLLALCIPAERAGMILLFPPAMLLCQWLAVRGLLVAWRDREAAEDAQPDPFADDDRAATAAPAAVNPLDAPP